LNPGNTGNNQNTGKHKVRLRSLEGLVEKLTLGESAKRKTTLGIMQGMSKVYKECEIVIRCNHD